MDVPDKKKQRTLLRGLHQDAFESFIEFAEDKEDWEDYNQLLRSTIKKAATKKVLEKLNALKPGTHSAFTTRAARKKDGSDADRRLRRVESILTTMAAKPRRGPGECYHGRNCTRRDCRFEHPGPRAGAERGRERTRREGSGRDANRDAPRGQKRSEGNRDGERS